jgi:prevent-host-death family protein
MRLSATELRSQLYRILDRVAETGEPVEIVRKGRTLKIVVEREPPRTFSADRLVPHPGTIVGDPEELIHLDWSEEWTPDGGEE